MNAGLIVCKILGLECFRGTDTALSFDGRPYITLSEVMPQDTPRWRFFGFMNLMLYILKMVEEENAIGIEWRTEPSLGQIDVDSIGWRCRLVVIPRSKEAA